MTTAASYPGFTSTEAGDLDKGLDYTIDAARRVREHMGVVSRLCDRKKLKRGKGFSYNEPRLGQLEARDLPEHGFINDPQTHYIEEVISIRPRGVGIQTIITDTLKWHLNPMVFAQMGKQAQEAVTRKKDIDGLMAFNAATLTENNAGAFNYHELRNFRYTMTASDDPAKGQVRVIMHGFQMKSIEDDLIDNVRQERQSYGEVSKGVTADVLRNGMTLRNVSGVRIFEDNNIRIRSSRAKAPVFVKEGMLLVEDMIMSKATDRLEDYGEGATRLHLRDRYKYGSRRPTLWIGYIESDATTPVN